jgi:hypothetical protein
MTGSVIGSEKQFVDYVFLAFQSSGALKAVFKRINLAARRFEEVWKVWWSGEVPPKLEVDLVLAFEDWARVIDEALLVAIEVKYFKSGQKSKSSLNFYEGLQQALAYTLFGFDGVSLWHMFDSNLSDETVRSYSQAMASLINEYKLPVLYLASQVASAGDEVRVVHYTSVWLHEPQELGYALRSYKHYFADATKRNPLLKDDEVRRRRSTIKTMLGIPV